MAPWEETETEEDKKRTSVHFWLPQKETQSIPMYSFNNAFQKYEI